MMFQFLVFCSEIEMWMTVVDPTLPVTLIHEMNHPSSHPIYFTLIERYMKILSNSMPLFHLLYCLTDFDCQWQNIIHRSSISWCLCMHV